MLSIQLMNNSSPIEKIGKILSAGSTYSCVLKDDTSVLDPVIILQTSDNIFSFNYMYISDFGRYYYIKDIKSVNNNRWEITAHVDVLETYATAIKANSAVIKRQEKKFNLYLNDPEFKVLNPEKIQTLKFPQGFNKVLNNILIVNGS